MTSPSVFCKSASSCLWLFCSIIFSNAFAQAPCVDSCSCSISGTIVDFTTGEPIPFATIKMKNSTKGALTDQKGYFILKDLCETEFDLVISHVGYKNVIHHHDIYHTALVVKLAPDNMILESVVVEGASIETGLESVTETKLSGKDLEDVKHESLGDILATITGVSTLKTGQNVVKPIIHGLHSNRVLIINNGIRHESQGWGEEHAPEIDASLAENISLVKGAAAVKYGPDAMGGVIIINPPKMELTTDHLHGEAGITAATNGRALNGDLLLQQGYKDFAWMGQLAGRYQGDLKAPDYQLTNTGARDLSYTLGTRYHKGNYDFSLYYSHVQQQLGILRGSVVGNMTDLDQALRASKPFNTKKFSYDINNPHQDVSHDFLRFKGVYNWPNSQMDVQYGFQINRRKEFDVRRGTNNKRPSIDLELFTHSLDIDWQHPSWLGWEGTIGAQLLYQDNNNLPGTNTIPFVPNYNNSRFGLYLSESKQLGNITFETGIRYDHQYSDVRGRDNNNAIYKNTLAYQSVTGLVGINFRLGEYSTLQSNIGTAWRPPNIAELYSYGRHNTIIEYGLWRYEIDDSGNAESLNHVLNENTRPVNNEIGVKWVNTYNYTVADQSLEFTGFINYLSNYLYAKPSGIAADVRGPLPFYTYDQTDAVYFGLDGSYILKHNNSWQSRLTGSYLYAGDVKHDDVFIGIPANRISYKLLFNENNTLNLDRIDASIEGNYTFKQYRHPHVVTVADIQEAQRTGENIFDGDASNFDFIAAPEGYFLLNAKVHITVQQFILGLQVKNMLNNSYRSYTNLMRYFANEPGINFLFSVRYKF